MRTIFVLTSALLLFALEPPPCFAEDDQPRFVVVRPEGEAHELLPKTCSVCHRDSPYQFVVVAATSQEGLDRALALLSAPKIEAGRKQPTNPHIGIACLFCHMEQPAEGAAASGLRFRTLTGAEANVSEVDQLCEMCHPQGEEEHARAVGAGNVAVALYDAGLPVTAGKVVCTTCHEMHESEVGPADLRLGYLAFARKNPLSYVHGNRVACLACHPTELLPGATPVFLDTDPTSRCVRCHEANHGGAHPMQVKPSEKTYPLDFLVYPLDAEGRLSCSTCHDEPCYGSSGDPRFLRGGPYYTPTEFCYKCHPRAGLGALNAHDQIDSQGRVVASTCAFCHRRVPDQADPDAPPIGLGDLTYLHSPVELCTGCHDSNPHPSGINHLVEMDPARREKLTAYEERHRVSMPLDDAQRIVCTTCHNPHAKGVLADEAALGAGEQHLWRIPSFAELCTPCHARYD